MLSRGTANSANRQLRQSIKRRWNQLINFEFEPPSKGSFESISFAALIIGGTLYGIATRTPQDFLDFPAVGAFWLYVVMAAWILARWTIYPRPRIKRDLTSTGWFILLVVLPVVSCYVAVVYYGIGVAIKDVFFWSQRPANSQQVLLFFGGIATLFISAILFVFRQRLRGVYGFSEAVVGVAVAVYKIAQDSAPSSEWGSGTYVAVLTAGVYLVVRGFDNMHIGLTKEPIDPVATWFRALLFGSPLKPNSKRWGPKNKGSEVRLRSQSRIKIFGRQRR